MKHDVVIIGGSLAGASCARELTRQGIEAVALERDVFPRAKVCGGFLSPNAVDCLERLDLLNEVRATDAVKIRSAQLHTDNVEREIQLRRTGLGISRSRLDDVVARAASVRHGITVRTVVQTDEGFVLQTDRDEIRTPVLIDAAGKLSRLTKRAAVPEFGVQYLDAQPRGAVLNFWFFPDGYGDAVTIEGGQSNFCFLIRKEALRRYAAQPGRLWTGPLAYDRLPGSVIAIGDAAGMIDPFCGEGMHHAFDSAITAARVVAQGLKNGRTYAEMQQAYDLEWTDRKSVV